jgi:hypothetical protein
MDRGGGKSGMRRLWQPGTLAALAFNAALFAAPLAAFNLYETTQTTKLLDYTPRQATVRESRRALNAEMARFSRSDPRKGRPRDAWNAWVSQELNENDAVAARGFVLAAPLFLSNTGMGRSAEGDIAERLRTGADQLEPVVRSRFLLVSGSGAGMTSFSALDDPRVVAEHARRWRAGEDVDLFLLRLQGLALTAPEGAEAQFGASVLSIARTAAVLSVPFDAYMTRQLEAAAPTGILLAEIDAALQASDSMVDPGLAVVQAFQRVRQPEAWAALNHDLNQIAEIARHASPAGGSALLKHADTPVDLERLALVAAAGGEMTVALAKRTPDRLVLKSARGAINWTPRLVIDLAFVAGVLFTLLAAFWAAFSGALRHEWSGAAKPRYDTPARGANFKAAPNTAKPKPAPQPAPAKKKNTQTRPR